jgi:outer membrane protein assembly factor BamB
VSWSRQERRFGWIGWCSGLAVALWATVPPAVWADWAQYRHDAAHTGCADEPATPPLELRWQQTDCPDGMYNVDHATQRLVTFDGDLYLRDSTVGLARLDGETGEVVWQQEGFPQDWLVAVASGAIVTAGWVPRGQRMYQWDAWIDAYDVETGLRAWRLVHPQDLPGFLLDGCGPTAADSTSICTRLAGSCLARGGRLCAIGMLPIERGKYKGRYEACLLMVDIREGRVIGKSTCNPGRTEPLIAPGAILPEDPGFYDAEVPPYQDWFWLWAWGDRLALLSHYEERPTGRGLLAGPWAVSSDAVLAMTPDDVPVQRDPWWRWPFSPTVALAERAGVAVGYTGRYGHPPSHLTARHASSGQFLWTRPLVAFPSNTSPAVDDERAYLGLVDGYVYAVDLMTGDVEWSTKVGAPEAEWASEPVGLDSRAPHCSVAGKTVWVIYHYTLLALDAETGDTKWQTDKTRGMLYEPVIDNGFVYLLTQGGVEAWGPPTKGGETEAKEGRLEWGTDGKRSGLGTNDV